MLEGLGYTAAPAPLQAEGQGGSTLFLVPPPSNNYFVECLDGFGAGKGSGASKA